MLTDIAIIVLAALLGNLIFNKVGLPGILGMVAAGVLLGPSGLDLIEPEVLGVLKEAKTVALIVILIRAGLGISQETLHRIGGPAIRMGFVPGLVEGAAVTAGSYYLLGLPFFESGMLGFIIAAVSPAVVVPTMLELKAGGFGKKKEVPTLVLAGASVDDVFAITIFGVFAGLASGVSTDWSYLLLGVPGGIVLGAAIGGGIGFALVWFFKRYHLRDTHKVILFMIIAVVFYDLAEEPAVKALLPIAALLGIMAIGLAARSLGVWLALAASDLSSAERLFCIIAYLPKATVQAAMGAVPLAMVMEGRMTSMTAESGQVILAMAVLSIVVTAPLGAIGIKVAGPRLLTQE